MTPSDTAGDDCCFRRSEDDRYDAPPQYGGSAADGEASAAEEPLDNNVLNLGEECWGAYGHKGGACPGEAT